MSCTRGQRAPRLACIVIYMYNSSCKSNCRRSSVKRVSIRGIAAKLGVSPMTVSNVMNGRGRVSAEKTKAVLAAAKEMGFRKGAASPFGHAAVPASRPVVVFNGKSHVEEASENVSIYRDIYFRLFERLGEHGCEVRLADSEVQRFAVDLAMADAVIEIDSIRKKSRTLSSATRICVFFDEPGCFSVCTDTASAGRVAAELLAKQYRHRRLAVFWRVLDQKARALAFLDNCKALDPKVDVEVVQVGNDEAGVIQEVLGRPVSARPTAVFMTYGTMAPGVFKCAMKLNLHIPSDLTLLGFDDFPLYAWLPQEVSRLYFDPNAFADVIFDAVEAALDKRPPIQYVVPVNYKRGATLACRQGSDRLAPRGRHDGHAK